MECSVLLVTYLLVILNTNLIRQPDLDWNNVSSTLKKHKKNPYRIARVADDFLAIERGKKKDIECTLNANYNALVEKNRKNLVRIVEEIVFCVENKLLLYLAVTMRKREISERC
ncbi:hypothetical protein DPMN_067116 [Dreissena polymorpha]|uniref:Uncharacterized protein n=1 Tax=Dreissena polymorpha TaxID=45954 RepID=A0A9D4BSK4_DREPO|nr:hypothetical protein DPMN_067116 [Dreissena polymorpha]